MERDSKKMNTCATLRSAWRSETFFGRKKPKEGEHFLRYAADLEKERSGGGRREDQEEEEEEEKMLQNVASIRERRREGGHGRQECAGHSCIDVADIVMLWRGS